VVVALGAANQQMDYRETKKNGPGHRVYLHGPHDAISGQGRGAQRGYHSGIYNFFPEPLWGHFPPLI